jgi:hypothetical protein
MQHFHEVFLQEPAKLISFASVDSIRALPCLGSNRVLPYRSILEGKYCQIN